VPYAFTATPLDSYKVDGIHYTVFQITETDVEATSEWSFPVPSLGRVTLFESAITDGGSASTIDPQMSTAAGIYDSVGALPENDTPAAAIYNDESTAYYAAGATLYGRSQPDATANEIVTRVTVARGH